MDDAKPQFGCNSDVDDFRIMMVLSVTFSPDCRTVKGGVHAPPDCTTTGGSLKQKNGSVGGHAADATEEGHPIGRVELEWEVHSHRARYGLVFVGL